MEFSYIGQWIGRMTFLTTGKCEVPIAHSESMRHAMPSLAITLVLSTTLMSRMYLRLIRSKRSTSSRSSALLPPNSMLSSAYRMFIRPPICSPPWSLSTFSLITISARLSNKYGERKGHNESNRVKKGVRRCVLSFLRTCSTSYHNLAEMVIRENVDTTVLLSLSKNWGIQFYST